MISEDQLDLKSDATDFRLKRTADAGTGDKLTSPEQAFKENARYLNTILETEPECVKMLDADGNLLMMNRAGLEMIEADSLEQVRGQSVFPIITAPYRNAFMVLTKQIFQGIPGTMEFEIIGLKGRHLWLETHAVPFRNEQEEIIALLGITRNITDRKAAEDALRKSEAKYHTLVETSQDLIWQCDTEGRFTYLNHAVEQVFGYKVNEMLGKKFSDFQTPENAKYALEKFTFVMQGNSVNGFESAFVGKSGTEIILKINALSMCDENGEIVGVSGTSYDITEYKRVDDALRRSHSLLTRAESVAHVGSWEWEVATDTMTWSEEMFRIFQQNPIDGAPSFAEHSKIFLSEDMVELKRVVGIALSEGNPYEMELHAVLPNGESRICLARGLPERTPDGRVTKLFGTLQDITERKQTEMALQRNEKLYRTTLHTLLDGFWIVDMEGRFIDVNKAYCKIIGYTRSEILGMSIQDVEALEKKEDIENRITNIFLHGSHRFESQHRCKDGHIVELEICVSRIPDTDRLCASLRDITDLKQAKKKLEESNRLLDVFHCIDNQK